MTLKGEEEKVVVGQTESSEEVKNSNRYQKKKKIVGRLQWKGLSGIRLFSIPNKR